jgi:hypothetical protein
MDSTPPPPPPPFSPAPPPSSQPAPGWWGRNWKWFVPTGCCLGSLLGLLLCIAIFGMGIFGLVSGISKIVKSSEPYQTAMAAAKANDKVVSAIGTPIDEGSPTGHVNPSDDGGDTDLKIPISGPKGKGTIYVAGYRSDGKWVFSRMLVMVDGTGEKIYLIE